MLEVYENLETQVCPSLYYTANSLSKGQALNSCVLWVEHLTLHDMKFMYAMIFPTGAFKIDRLSRGGHSCMSGSMQQPKG